MTEITEILQTINGTESRTLNAIISNVSIASLPYTAIASLDDGSDVSVYKTASGWVWEHNDEAWQNQLDIMYDDYEAISA